MKQVSLIYWIENNKTNVELVLPKHGIFPQLEATGFKAIDFIQSGMWWLRLVLEFKKPSEITLVAQGTLSRLLSKNI